MIERSLTAVEKSRHIMNKVTEEEARKMLIEFLDDTSLTERANGKLLPALILYAHERGYKQCEREWHDMPCDDCPNKPVEFSGCPGRP